ncbi:hypothetical protein [Prochlorococcus sp. MIT 1307]|uniref:hypothetical protein n=1 Tax=Prochlorococcus sp. MIT 1307 TaxID=3096219 RepID=UPI002A75745B|nr:hypothetical protein [Prochlorococcus sp. MIT 1307]
MSASNEISYAHLGKYVTRATFYSKNILKKKLQLPIRVNRAKNYLEKYNNEKNIIHWINTRPIAKKMLEIYSKNRIRRHKWQFRSLKELQNLSYDQYNIGIGVASTLITELGTPEPFPLSSAAQKECFQLIHTSIKSQIFAKLLLTESDFDTLVLFNGRMASEHAFKQVASSLKIKMYFHERSNKGNTRYFFEGYMPHDFAKRKHEMQQMKDELSEQMIKRLGHNFFYRKVRGQGVLEQSYTKGQLEEFSYSLGSIIRQKQKSNIPIISYFSSSDDEYQSIDGAPERYPYFTDQKLAIKKISEIVKSLGYYFIVRVHPNLKNKDLYEQKRWNNLSIDIRDMGFYWIDQNDPESTYKLIQNSSLVLSAGSTVGIEAIYLRRPSLVIANSFYDSIIPSVRLCQNEEDLLEYFSNPSWKLPPDPAESYIYGAWITCYGPEYKYYVPTDEMSVLHGIMKDGTRIASPGISQRIIEHFKQNK